MIIISSLPDSWDTFTSAYFGSKSSTSHITPGELISLILEEDNRRREKTGSSEVVNQARASNHSKRTSTATGPPCANCKKAGHTKENCWAKGGGKEGQGPCQKKKENEKDKKPAETSSQAIEELPDMAYQASQFDSLFTKYDWLADSGTSSHIAMQQ
jgi:hypothetical protein